MGWVRRLRKAVTSREGREEPRQEQELPVHPGGGVCEYRVTCGESLSLLLNQSTRDKANLN